MSQNNDTNPKPKTGTEKPKVDKTELENSIRTHEKAVKTNQIVKK
jgi:hypothetical protein